MATCWKCKLNLLYVLLFYIYSFPISSFAQSYKAVISANISSEKKEQILDSIFSLAIEKPELYSDSTGIQFGDYLALYSIWLSKKGSLKKAIDYAEKGVYYSKNRTPYKLQFHYGNLFNLGLYYQRLRSYTSSNEIFFEIIKLKGISNLKKARAYDEIGRNLIHSGSIYSGIAYLEKCQQLYHAENAFKKELRIIIRIAQNYQKTIKKQDLQKGLKKLEEINLLKSKIELTSNDRFDIYETYGNLYNSINPKPLDSIYKYYNNALTIAKQQKSNFKIHVTYNNIGTLFRNINKDSALYYFNKAQKLSINNDTEQARTLHNKGRIYIEKQQYNKAISSFETALSLFDITPENIKSTEILEQNNVTRNDALIIEILRYIGIAWLYKSKDQDLSLNNNLQNALSYFKKSDQLIDQMKLEKSEAKSKLYWRRNASSLYIHMVDIYHRLGQPKMAYYYSEKNKAMLLLEDLHHARLRQVLKLPKQILEKEYLLIGRMAKTKNLISKQASEKTKDSLRMVLFDQKEAYEYFIDSLKTDFPNYYYSKKTKNILSLKTAQKLAKQYQTAFIEYILNDEKGYGILITANKTVLFPLQTISALQKKLLKFNQLISKPFSTKKDKSSYEKIASELHEILLPKQMRSDLNEKIIIIPDNILHNIPFDALLEPNGTYLLQNHDISYAYSISFLEQNKKLIRNSSNEFLGFAPVQYSNNLPTLPKSKIEVEQISTFFNSTTLFEDRSSEKQLKDTLAHYKIVHLSTHAYANDSITPWIATANSKITLNDIYATKNNAELITLSACNTSIGKIENGEGIISLARGFLNTGAHSVLASLWKADDTSTMDITKSFYSYLKKGKSKSEALRLAKLDYLESHTLSQASPYYWSAFVLIGDPDSMYTSFPIWSIVIVLIVGALLFFLFKKK